MIVDDPVKNHEEAESFEIKEKIWEWYRTTAYTRLAPGGGILLIQCMTGDTPVTMADGSWKELEEVRPGDMVMAYKDGQQVPRRVLNFASQGEDEVLEIRTSHARVRANARHPFLVERKGGAREWVRAGDLKPKDALVSEALREGGADRWVTDEEAWLLGFMFGDGWLTVRKGWQYDKVRDTYYPRQGQLVLCVALSDKPALNERVLSLFEKLFPGGRRPKPGKYGYARTERQVVGRWFRDHGLVGNAKTKRLPPWLYGQPRAVREAFLAGFCAADGAEIGSGPNMGRMSVGLCNPELVKDLRHLARGLGHRVTNAHQSTYTRQPPNSPKPVESVDARVSWTQDARTVDAFRLTRVRSVESAGRAEVFDLQVDDAECFLADGLVSHNTRWSDDDLAGRILSHESAAEENWDVVLYPAIATQDEPYRKRGESFHPARWPVESLEKIRRLEGERNWAALYQQNPVPDEGAYFAKEDISWYDYRELKIGELRFYQTWDLAIGQNETNDYTVGLTAGMDAEGDLYLVDLVRGRWRADGIVDQILGRQRAWNPELVGVEKGHIQMSIGPFLERRQREEKVHLNILPLATGRADKQLRARAIQGRIEQKRVHFPKDLGWAQDLLAEMLRFPAGRHDDQVDALAWMGLMLEEQQVYRAPPSRRGPKNDVMDRVRRRATRRAGAGVRRNASRMEA